MTRDDAVQWLASLDDEVYHTHQHGEPVLLFAEWDEGSGFYWALNYRPNAWVVLVDSVPDRAPTLEHYSGLPVKANWAHYRRATALEQLVFETEQDVIPDGG